MKLITKQIHKMAMPALIAGAMVTLSALQGGQDSGNSSQPHFSGQAPGEAQEILRRFEGLVSAVDLKAMTLTIKLAEGPRTFKVTSKTKFTHERAAASLSAVVVGKTVEVIVKLGRGQPDEVATVNIKAE